MDQNVKITYINANISNITIGRKNLIESFIDTNLNNLTDEMQYSLYALNNK